MRSGFFNSEIIGYDSENMPVFDRAEEASFFAKYFSQFISNGVFPNPSTNMQVLASSGMNVTVAVGVCYINGYMGWVESTETLEIEESDTQARIDRIVARLDFEDRSINLFVKKGTAQGNPVAPDVQRDYDIYEIALADVRVNANVISISQSNITDLRLNTDVCGIVANQLQHVDTTTLFNQYQTWLTETTGQAEIDLAAIKQDFEDYVSTTKTAFNGWIQAFKTAKTEEFEAWFATIQDILDEDTAGHLYNLIIANTAAIEGKVDKVAGKGLSTNDYTTDEKNQLEGILVKTFTIATSAWNQNAQTSLYEATISDTTVNSYDNADVSFDSTSYEAASDAGIKGYVTEVQDTGIKLYADSVPSSSVSGKYVVNRGVANG